MKLKELTLKNFRCYPDLTIEFQSQVTVLIAANGEGKTSILDALRIAFWPFVSQFDLARTAYNDPANGIQIDDVLVLRPDASHVQIKEQIARQLPCEINTKCEFNHETLSWTRIRKSEAKRSQTIDGEGVSKVKKLAQTLQKQVRNLEDTHLDLPLFGYYGTGRLWQHKRLTQSKKNATDRKNQKVRTFAYRDCLDPASSYREFEEWFISIYKTAREEQIQALEQGDQLSLQDTPYFSLIKVIQDAINTVLEPVGWHDLEFSQKLDASLALNHKEQGKLKVSQLSDGIKNMLGLVADIAYRCVLLNGHLLENAAKETQGVIMIDEVDMHLHPIWQQMVVSSLTKAFPSLQFILTTHSPQVLSTIDAKDIRILVDGMVYSAPAGSKGAESSRLLNRIFKVDSRPPHDPNTLLLKQYEKLVYDDMWDSEEALELRHQLNEIFADEEPKLTELDLHIENRQWEKELEKSE